MGNLKIGWRPAASVGDLLQWLGKHRALMAGRMDQRDIQTVAWLLTEASSDRRHDVGLLPPPCVTSVGSKPAAGY